MAATDIRRLALIGNSLPRRCGIATFTTDLQQALAQAAPAVDTVVVAMTDGNRAYDYPAVVGLEINDAAIEEYERAAAFLNAKRVDVVSLQHEFGIYGGEGGSHILALLSRLTMPVVTTLHTVLEEPSALQLIVLTRIAEASAKVVVMAERGRALLRSVYGVPADKIEVIPHGIPDFPFVDPETAKAKLGYDGRSVILTFGLLSPNKGIEIMIDAMPGILERRPDAVYVVLGATHPNLVRERGEAYRDSLVQRVRTLGIEDHVVFLDRFVDQSMLLDFISMCDVYVTPYLSEAQMTSGTLAYSFGLGRAVVSTPYWHAEELLADGRGLLVPFGDAAAIGEAISGLLTDPARRQGIQERAYAGSRSMVWSRTADRYLSTFEDARSASKLKILPRAPTPLAPRGDVATPDMRISHLLTMCDDTGLFQHAVHSVPDRSHGYCVDDNARALLVACALNGPGEQPLPDVLTSRFAAFIQHAWNPDRRRFRNFMSFDRRWLEEQGSEDSHGRTLWALGEAARSDASATRRRWAAGLFAEALPIVEEFHSPRAWAFTLLGLDGYLTTGVEDAAAERLRLVLADRLLAQLPGSEESWQWFEAGLAYDNARLPQALIVSGRAMGSPSHVGAGLRSLRWLMAQQTAPGGAFRPVGSESFGDMGKRARPFDQQPLEATATISACLAALRADGDAEWRAGVRRAFNWFFGANDLGMALVDPETGSCRDGLHPDRPNENCGGESVVSYLLSLAEIRQLRRLGGERMRLTPSRALRA